MLQRCVNESLVNLKGRTGRCKKSRDGLTWGADDICVPVNFTVGVRRRLEAAFLRYLDGVGGASEVGVGRTYGKSWLRSKPGSKAAGAAEAGSEGSVAGWPP